MQGVGESLRVSHGRQQWQNTTAEELFAEAYNQGFVTDNSLVADKLRDSIMEQWFTHDKDEDDKHVEYLNKLHNCWYEWTYAWNHVDKKRP